MRAVKMHCTALHCTGLTSSAGPHPFHLHLCVCVCVRVFVADSTIKGAGQGLFAKTDADKDTVMAFYNGVRITHSEVGAGDDDTFITSFSISRTEFIVLSLIWSLHTKSEVTRQTGNVFKTYWNQWNRSHRQQKKNKKNSCVEFLGGENVTAGHLTYQNNVEWWRTSQ